MIDVTTTFAVISWKKEAYRIMIADKIKNARTIKKLTQEQVAEDLNVSRQTISNWENGCSVPDSSMLISLADELDTSVSILLGENVSESPADDLRKQEREFLRFIREDAHFCKYYDAIFILFNTGLRISEFCGLTKSDLDFKNKRIRVNHQLQRTSQMQYIIEKPKTESGERYVPMSDEVVACFKRILKDRVNPKVEPMVDGMTGFLFLDKNDMPMVALHWEKYFQHIREKYNSIYKVQMPPITPHVCRHTFCSNMAKSGMNPKMLQYIMGHSDISVTMNTYTHVKFQDAQEDFQKAINS